MVNAIYLQISVQQLLAEDNLAEEMADAGMKAAAETKEAVDAEMKVVAVPADQKETKN